MIDMQKAVYIECIQLDGLGDNYTPKKPLLLSMP